MAHIRSRLEFIFHIISVILKPQRFSPAFLSCKLSLCTSGNIFLGAFVQRDPLSAEPRPCWWLRPKGIPLWCVGCTPERNREQRHQRKWSNRKKKQKCFNWGSAFFFFFKEKIKKVTSSASTRWWQKAAEWHIRPIHHGEYIILFCAECMTWLQAGEMSGE